MNQWFGDSIISGNFKNHIEWLGLDGFIAFIEVIQENQVPIDVTKGEAFQDVVCIKEVPFPHRMSELHD